MSSGEALVCCLLACDPQVRLYQRLAVHTNIPPHTGGQKLIINLILMMEDLVELVLFLLFPLNSNEHKQS